MKNLPQPNFYLNDQISLQVKEAFSLYYFIKIGVKLTNQNEIFLLISFQFFSNFLEEIYPEIFSKLPSDKIKLILDFLDEGKTDQLFDYVKQTSPYIFVSPELFFENVPVLKERILESWFFPLKHYADRRNIITSKIENGLIAHYKYKYFLFPLNFGSLRSEKTE